LLTTLEVSLSPVIVSIDATCPPATRKLVPPQGETPAVSISFPVALYL